MMTLQDAKRYPRDVLTFVEAPTQFRIFPSQTMPIPQEKAYETTLTRAFHRYPFGAGFGDRRQVDACHLRGEGHSELLMVETKSICSEFKFSAPKHAAHAICAGWADFGKLCRY